MTTSGVDNKIIRLKKPFFLLLGFTLYPLLIFFGFAGYLLEQHHFKKNALTELHTVERLFSHQADLYANQLQSLINHYAVEPELQEAFLSQSRDKLYRAALPLFQTILDQGISHFYFINKDQTCFLRVHNPERHGDTIERFTTQEAARTGHLSAGLEMGPYGTFTLRAVQPWYINGNLAGYLELGRDIKNLTGNLKEILDMELFFLISKQHLDRATWEEGLWMTGKSGNWNEDQKHVIFDRTLPNLPDELVEYIDLPHDEKEGLMFQVSIEGRNYRGGFLPLRDARGKELGEIIALRDCTDALSSQMLSTLFVVGSVGVGLLIFSLFYTYANSLEGRLQQTYNDLNREIESRKEVENKLRRHEEELELLVHERTTRLEQANAQLHQEAQERIKIAEELLKAQRLESIGILAGGIAHDFNNLLAVILGNINLAAMDENLSATNRQILQEAEKASLQAKTLTQQLITFSDGGTPFRRAVNIGELLKQVVRDLVPSTITCNFAIAEDLWCVKADEKQLEQVFYNLVENACIAMTNAGILQITCSNEDYQAQKDLSLPAQKFVKIAITDSGCGIAKEHLTKIFDPYFSTKDKNSTKGRGLGLAVAHSIIAKHQGFIRVESVKDQGTTFSVYLPAHLDNRNR